MLNVLLVGSGGREHALAWRLALSDKCHGLYCAPGNAGMEECAELVDIAADDIEGLTKFAQDKNIDLVVVGPEVPLVEGLVDALQKQNIKAFGPCKDAAQLEGSKRFMKDFCKKYDIPTAFYGQFTDLEAAKAFIDEQNMPIVVKADGLAAGKGVVIANSRDEAYEAAEVMLSGQAFGDAGRSIVIEEFLQGEEVSYFALCDGKIAIPFGTAQDHKRAYDGDEGPNTGGMGAYSPSPLVTPEMDRKIFDTIIRPVVEGMEKEGMPFTGILFAGLMVDNGEPRLLEFNTRFGDPECQALMMLLEADLLNVLYAAACGKLTDVKDDIFWRYGTAMCVVMAAEGYPGSYKKNTLIEDIGKADLVEDSKVFHAGTAFDEDKNIISIGGRVLGVTSYGESVEEAQQRAYNAISYIKWPEGFYRQDIGWRALKKA